MKMLPFLGPRFSPPNPTSFDPSSFSDPIPPSRFKLKILTVEHPSLYYAGNDAVFRCAAKKKTDNCRVGLEHFDVETRFKQDGPRTVYGVHEDELAIGIVLSCHNSRGKTVTTSDILWEGVNPWEAPSK